MRRSLAATSPNVPARPGFTRVSPVLAARTRGCDNSHMSLAHLTLPTRDVDGTARFFERTLGYVRNPVPGNSPVEALWLDIGRGQELHVFYVEGFVVGGFEGEFGRHVALFHPLADFPALRERFAGPPSNGSSFASRSTATSSRSSTRPDRPRRARSLP
jgi:catechol 2,3-dioxygenase-like lactoylglutathione lyase family enzyme